MVAHWTVGQQSEQSILHLGHVIPKFILLAQVIPGPVIALQLQNLGIKRHSFHFYVLLYRWLYRDGLLPKKTYFVGYARSQLSPEEVILKRAYPFLKVNVVTGMRIIRWSVFCLCPCYLVSVLFVSMLFHFDLMVGHLTSR